MASDRPPGALSNNADDDTNSDLTYSSNDLESSLEQKQLVFLQNERSYIRFEASKRLAELGKTHSWVLPDLVQWIEQHQDEDCVGAGIDALWEIVEGE